MERFSGRIIAVALICLWPVICPLRSAVAEEPNLVQNARFDLQTADGHPAGYDLAGDVSYQYLGNRQTDITGQGIALVGGEDLNKDGSLGGAVSQTVPIDLKDGRWFRFAFRGLPQDGFKVPENGLQMKVEFLGGAGKSYDGKLKQLYSLIEQARHDLSVNGSSHIGGAAVWRDYVLDFYVPFPRVDHVKVTVAFSGNAGSQKSTAAEPPDRHGGFGPPPMGPGSRAGNQMRGPRGDGGGGAPGLVKIDSSGNAFFVSEFSLTRITNSAELLRANLPGTQPVTADPSLANLLSLGGRWYYQPRPGETQPPALFDHTNSDRLLYKDGPPDQPFEAPFAGNTSAWLRAGDKDLSGKIVPADVLLEENVTVKFNSDSLIVHTLGIPNHPTGKFPETIPGRGNPSYIQEQESTYYIPLNPKINPAHISTDTSGSNRALNMGPIGVAVNGVVFFNPFDGNMSDASSLMDRCCGHPNPDNLYHYHKYPVCVNSPWADEGKAHSPLIGWAFDGFPIYGPYESENVMAKDLQGPSALNDFNIHFDPQRGWHYHATPGKFPYIIGGYWGTADSHDTFHPHGNHGGPHLGADARNGGGGPPPGGGPDGFAPPPLGGE